VVDRLIEAIDEDVSESALAQRGVAMAPHDAACAATNRLEIERVERALRIVDAVEIHVRVAERATRRRITAHTH
jgi:hypothetical protein